MKSEFKILVESMKTRLGRSKDNAKRHIKYVRHQTVKYNITAEETCFW
jgi:hypothetical protein